MIEHMRSGDQKHLLVYRKQETRTNRARHSPFVVLKQLNDRAIKEMAVAINVREDFLRILRQCNWHDCASRNFLK
jgi:hypothetical protein